MSAVITIAFDDLINIYKMGDKFGVPLVAPNFDRLADMGVNFDAAYASVAVCNPSRTAAMSGQSQFRTGLHNTNDQQWMDVLGPEETLIGMFNDAGWTTYGSGKVYHNSTTPGDQPMFNAFYDHHFQTSPATTPKHDNNPVAEPLDPWETMRDDGNVAWAIDQLNAYDGSENMLMTLGIIKPHKPFIAPQEYFDLYPQEDLVIPYQDGDLEQVTDFYKQFRLLDGYQRYLDNNGYTLDFIQGYLAALSYADAKLGEVLDALENNPALADASLVVWSDHGYELGDKQTWNKFTLWEEAANIPFIVVDPDLVAGSTASTPVTLLDLVPTLLDLADLPAPAGAQFDGVSVLPFIDVPQTDRIAITSMLGSVSMRTEEYRFVLYNDGSVELYDVVSDPEQLTNLALDPAYNTLIGEMTLLLQAEVTAQGGVFDPDALALFGTGGADSMFVIGAQEGAGGNGDDTYFVADGAIITEAADGGFDRVIFADREFTVPDNVEFVKNSSFFNASGFTLFGGDQDTYIKAQSTRGLIYAQGGQDTIEGSGARDTLYGGDGDDLISGGRGFDQLDGGAGRDTLDYSFSVSAVGADMAQGIGLAGEAAGDVMFNFEDMRGGQFNDSLTGNAAGNMIEGVQGADLLVGLDGNDTLFGDTEDDTLRGGNGDDHLDGGEGRDVLQGQGGSDILLAGGEADTVTGGLGSDTVRGGAGNDEISGNGDDDTLYGEGHNDILRGDGGNDRLMGGTGADSLKGGTEDDVLLGGRGNDVLEGDAGQDRLFGHAGNDGLFGGSGDDDLRAGQGTDTLDGEAGDDALRGEGGDDTLMGGAGHDTLSGGTGMDVLDGGAGNDLLFGNGGDDILVFALGGGQDTVQGFQIGRDVLYLDQTLWTGAIGVEDVLLQFADSVGANSVEFSFIGGETLIINATVGITPDSLVNDIVFI